MIVRLYLPVSETHHVIHLSKCSIFGLKQPKVAPAQSEGGEYRPEECLAQGLAVPGTSIMR